MITIIHGDDIGASRNYFNDIKQRSPEAVSVDGPSLTVTDLTQILDGGGLFQTEKTIIIENFYAKKKSPKEFEALVTTLQDNTLENEIFLWENKELDKKSLGFFKHATVKTYKLPQTLFLFLDSLKPNTGSHLVSLFQKVISTTEPEIVMAMLIRHVRILLALKQKSNDPIDEVKRLAPWQVGKLQKQAQLFTDSQLITLHEKLYKIDKGLKTGELSMQLATALDILLADI